VLLLLESAAAVASVANWLVGLLMAGNISFFLFLVILVQ
jgi:hypothetical protein